MDEEMRAWLDRLFGETDKDGVDRLVELDEFCPPDDTTFQRLAEVFESPVVSLAPYADHRIAQAFWDLSSNVLEKASWDRHMRLFNSIEVLFREFFAVRCKPALVTKDESSGPLNMLCYMWWDFDYCWHSVPDSSMLRTLRSILAMDHVACQESALHGLGHWCEFGKGQPEVESIIDEFLQGQPNVRPGIREYALSARAGKVQ
jgi:hypothetical protein